MLNTYLLKVLRILNDSLLVKNLQWFKCLGIAYYYYLVNILAISILYPLKPKNILRQISDILFRGKFAIVNMRKSEESMWSSHWRWYRIIWLYNLKKGFCLQVAWEPMRYWMRKIIQIFIYRFFPSKNKTLYTVCEQ